MTTETVQSVAVSSSRITRTRAVAKTWNTKPHLLGYDSFNQPDAAHLVHCAKAYCTDALALVAAETVQLHGGIAITWEHDAQRLFKRSHALGRLFGSAAEHRALVVL